MFNQYNYRTNWLTADPVTGTAGSFIYGIGASGYAVIEEENEPLGQYIYQHDPEDPAEPLPSEPLNNADYPQWQCAVDKEYYGGFPGMPIHCQKNLLREAGDKLPWEDETSVRYIIRYFTDSPMPADYGQPNSKSDDVMAYALNATIKKTDGDDDCDSTICIDASLPPKLKRARNLTAEELAIMRAIAATGIFDDEASQEIRIFGNNSSGINNVSYQGNQRFGEHIPNDLRDQVVEVDKDINCRAFIKLIFDDLQSRGEDYRSTSLVSIFDSTKVFEINEKQAGHTGHGAVAVRSGNAGYIYYAEEMRNFLGNTVAELTHLGKAGKDDYSDNDLDIATERVLGPIVVNLIKDLQKNMKKKKHPGNVGHFAINTACKTAVENAR